MKEFDLTYSDPISDIEIDSETVDKIYENKIEKEKNRVKKEKKG